MLGGSARNRCRRSLRSSVDIAIRAEGLVKRYREVVALDRLDLEVPVGGILGLLGPNGAGKTTAVRILTTLLVPDAGRAEVAGFDIGTESEQVRSRIGLSGQYAAVDQDLTGRENLVMVGRLSRLGRGGARRRAAELLERFDLVDAADRPVKGYSGGMRRRLDLAGALIATPPVLFLDEPTTGLDPRSRLGMWDVIRELTAGGTTLLLTTQYLEEADQLARDVMVIDHGRAIARGTPDELKAKVGGERIEIVVTDRGRIGDASAVLARHALEGVHTDAQTGLVDAAVRGGAATLAAVIEGLAQADVDVGEVGLRRATLDEVFLTLTGQPAGAPTDAEVDA
jgi:ABC-2 type transport system ATP-binding protein